jgi:hypothetical protein
MKLIRTAKIKLNISVAEMLPTMQAYTKAFNLVASVGWVADLERSFYHD